MMVGRAKRNQTLLGQTLCLDDLTYAVEIGPHTYGSVTKVNEAVDGSNPLLACLRLSSLVSFLQRVYQVSQSLVSCCSTSMKSYLVAAMERYFETAGCIGWNTGECMESSLRALLIQSQP